MRVTLHTCEPGPLADQGVVGSEDVPDDFLLTGGEVKFTGVPQEEGFISHIAFHLADGSRVPIKLNSSPALPNHLGEFNVVWQMYSEQIERSAPEPAEEEPMWPVMVTLAIVVFLAQFAALWLWMVLS